MTLARVRHDMWRRGLAPDYLPTYADGWWMLMEGGL